MRHKVRGGRIIKINRHNMHAGTIHSSMYAGTIHPETNLNKLKHSLKTLNIGSGRPKYIKF